MEYQLKTRETILQETKKQTDLFFVTQGSSLKLQNVMQKLMQQLHKENKQIESVKQIRASVITSWLKAPAIGKDVVNHFTSQGVIKFSPNGKNMVATPLALVCNECRER